MMKKTILIAATLALGLGCSNSDNNANSSTNSANNSSGFAGGAYTVTVLDVDDQCYDGAMDTIVLPDSMPRDLPSAVTLPAFADLPASIDIKFAAPFQDVTGVAVEASGSNGIKTAGTGFSQTGVDISAAADGGCLADMTVTFSMTESEAGTLTGSGSLEITAATGANCPVGTPPCKVNSNVRAVKN